MIKDLFVTPKGYEYSNYAIRIDIEFWKFEIRKIYLQPPIAPELQKKGTWSHITLSLSNKYD